MKIVSRFRLRQIAFFAGVLAWVGLIAAVPATIDFGDLSLKNKEANATKGKGDKDNDNDDGGDDNDDGGDDGDDGGDDGDDGGDDGGDGDDGGGDAGDDGGDDGGGDAGDGGGDDGNEGGGDAGSGNGAAASGSTNATARVLLPTIGDPRGIPTMFVVYFDWDSDKLDEQAQLVLSEAEAAIGKLGSAKVSVIGNTDRSGPTAYNEGLADRRAKAVAQALAGRGLPADVVGRKGYGEARPLVKTNDGVRKRLNRRVEIVVEAETQTANQ